MTANTSLSAKRFTWALVSGMSRWAAIAWDRVRLELPESSFMSGHPFAVIAGLKMRAWRWRATYQRTAPLQGATRAFAGFLRIGAAKSAGVEIASRFRGRRRVRARRHSF